MVRTSTKVISVALTALMALAGAGLAQGNPIALVTGEGGAAAEAAAEGGYHADATGAIDAANDHNKDLQQQARNTWHATDQTYAQAKDDARAQIDNAELPEPPEAQGEAAVFDQLDQASNVEATHADQIQKAADLETGYVDAGADLSATGKVSAFFKDAFTGIADAYQGIKDALTIDTSATDDAKSAVTGLMDADAQARGQVSQLIDQEHELPRAEPKLDGDLSASHATELATSAVGQGEASIP